VGFLYCSDAYRVAISPAVYRFICPDGRSYVGSRYDCREREEKGVSTSNTRLRAALEQYPADTWSYEVLQELPPGCPKRERLILEQFYIDRRATMDSAYGFNMLRAISNKSAASE
jgi:hypothetical protein